ncbi:MAG: UDP-2,3-diacylglucosamine diphosphatase [Gammaproteobacteria bacterium]|jgi:UDP-2,3-diacylglucosamine hydrolase
MPATLFISDLHLDAQRPATTRLLLDFLGSRCRVAEALYILGDLFESWIGDDDESRLHTTIIAALRAAVAAGTAVYLMHGNRDFLLGERFAEQTGCTLLDDPARIDLYGQATLLMHGDKLCTGDAAYLAYRSRIRDRQVRQAFLDKSLPERRYIAAILRRTSHAANRTKPDSILDVDPVAVIRTMSEYRVCQLIHGHTHRPAIHDLTVAGHPARRMVLGDWTRQGSVLACTARGCELQTFQPA